MRVLWCCAALGAVLGLGCVEPEQTATTCSGVAVGRTLVVLEIDKERTTSTLGRVDPDGCLTEVAAGLALSGDTVLAKSRGRIFVVDRARGEVRALDPATLTLSDPKFLAYGPMDEATTNPQDVAVDADGLLWITRWERTSLAIVDGTDGSWIDEVDLAQFADADGLPEMTAVTIVGGKAFVTLERLTDHGQDLDHRRPGKIAVVDTKTRKVVSSFDLQGTNPFGRFVPFEDDDTGSVVALTMPGSFAALDDGDGIARVDLAKSTSELMVDEQALGGSPVEAIVPASDEAYAIVAGTTEAVNPTSVVAFDPSTGKRTRTLAQTDGFYHAGLALSGQVLVVGDATNGLPRLVVYARTHGGAAGGGGVGGAAGEKQGEIPLSFAAATALAVVE